MAIGKKDVYPNRHQDEPEPRPEKTADPIPPTTENPPDEGDGRLPGVVDNGGRGSDGIHEIPVATPDE